MVTLKQLLVIFRWLLKITDFGLQKSPCEGELEDEEKHGGVSKLFWQAPELLRDKTSNGSQKGDVYSFAIVCYEILRRPGIEEGPYVDTNLSSDKILEYIRDPSKNDFTDTRPNLKVLKNHSEIEPPSSALSKLAHSLMSSNIIIHIKLYKEKKTLFLG